MALDLTSGTLTAVVGLVGVLLGALIGPFTNHQLGAKYNKKDLIFKRKLEYFERVIETIEKNRRMYYNSLCRIETIKNNKEIEIIIEELKQNRKNFLVMASPLYFNTKNFSEKIKSFVDIEKDIFDKVSEIKDNKQKAKIIEELKDNLEILNKKGDEIIFAMKRELIR